MFFLLAAMQLLTGILAAVIYGLTATIAQPDVKIVFVALSVYTLISTLVVFKLCLLVTGLVTRHE